MYLKSLELHGFKSFPDKTVLKFNSGVTVVVGPNGSGKSNMTDAMRWVLGELSTKSIRGSKMEDVIFAGSEGKKPMSFAEVSVTFDDSAAPKVLNTSYDEVTVTRRYYRSGDSEYFINKKKVRLRDIYELFMNTGIGREGYSIIGQGRIAEIISKKSEERRGVFEESAGIARFRYRKNESEKKLAETEANMARVADMEAELSARLGPLERDSAKARRYLELYGEKKKVDLSLWLFDMDRLTENINKATLDTQMSAHELELAEDDIRQTDDLIDRLYNQSHESKEELQRTHETLTRTAKEKADAQAQLLVYRNNVENTEGRAASEIALAETMKGDIAAEEENAKTARLRMEEAGKRHREAAEEWEKLSAKHTEAARAVEKKAGAIAETEEAARRCEEARTDLRVRRNVLSETLKTAGSRQESLAADQKNYETESEALRKTMEEAAAREKDIAGQIHRVEQEMREGSLDRYEAETAQLQAQIGLKKAEIDSLQSRITALRNMQEHFEGYYNSVRYVMQEKAAIGGIHGPISYLIKVEPGYVVAVETALGSALQNIVTDDEAAAKRAIRALQNAKAGRATFYPLTNIRSYGRGREYEGVERFPGFVGYADALTSYAPVYGEVVKSLLSRIAVFDTLDHASDMARASGWRVRAVTLDGQQINQGGSFTGGQTKRESGVLTRSSQIDGLVRECAVREKEKAELERALRQITRETQQAAERLAKLREKREALAAALAGEEKRQSDASTRRGLLLELIDNLKKDATALAKSYAEGARECEALEKAIGERTLELGTLKQKREEWEKERASFAEKADGLAALMQEKRIYCAELARDREAYDNVYAEASRRVEGKKSEAAAHEANAAAYREELAVFAKSIAETETAIAALTEAVETLTEKQRLLTEGSDQIEAELTGLRNKQKEQNAKKERVFIAHSKNEAKLEDWKNRCDKLSEALWNDYELTYSTAAKFAEENNCEAVADSSRASFVSRQNALKSSIKSLGNVNLDAIDEYTEVKKRYDYISTQLGDLVKSKKEIEKILADIEVDMKRMFSEAFEKINRYFGEVFRELFGGGHAEVVLTDPENVLTSGIEINAAPPGKSVKNLNLLSGGEQSFIAIALLFALIKVNPSPFCIFDEVEAALDEVNVVRVGRYVKKYSSEMQIIMITHRRGTMEIADTLYGVTMEQSGVSKVFTLDTPEERKAV